MKGSVHAIVAGGKIGNYQFVLSVILVSPSLSPPLELETKMAQGLTSSTLFTVYLLHIVALFGWGSDLTQGLYLHRTTQDRKQT